MPILRRNQTSVSFRKELPVILMHSFKKKSQTGIPLNLTEAQTEIKQTNCYQASLTPSIAITSVHTRQVTWSNSYTILLTFSFECYQTNIYVQVKLHSTEGEWNVLRHVNRTSEHNDRLRTYIAVRSCDRRCGGNAMRNTQSECVCL